VLYVAGRFLVNVDLELTLNLYGFLYDMGILSYKWAILSYWHVCELTFEFGGSYFHKR